MADSGAVIDIGTVKAAVDFSGSQYMAVRLDETSGQAKLGNATSSSLGILQNKPVTNRACQIRVSGESFGMCSGVIAYQDRLAPDDAGYLVATTTDNDEYIAIALGAHATDGASTILNVLVQRGRY